MYAAANEEAVDSQQLDSAPPWKTEDTAQQNGGLEEKRE